MASNESINQRKSELTKVLSELVSEYNKSIKDAQAVDAQLKEIHSIMEYLKGRELVLMSTADSIISKTRDLKSRYDECSNELRELNESTIETDKEGE